MSPTAPTDLFSEFGVSLADVEEPREPRDTNLSLDLHSEFGFSIAAVS